MRRIFTIIALALLTCIVYAQNDTIVVNNQRYVVVKEAPQQEKQVTADLISTVCITLLKR